MITLALLASLTLADAIPVPMKVRDFSAVSEDLSGASLGPVAPLVAELSGLDRGAQLVAVNAAVNRAITYTPEDGDTWSPASETVSVLRGDCEDYAIVKMAALHQLSVALADMRILVVKLDVGYHALLVVNDKWVLDNRNDRIRSIDQVKDTPLYSISAEKQLVYGKPVAFVSR